VKLTEPGVYDLDAETYHADPVEGGSLSSTGARKLMPPSCPATFRYWVDHPEQHKAVFDFGQAAHAEVLGIGRPLRVIDADDWRTKAAREQRDAAYAAGETPLLAADHNTVREMAAALRRHRDASALLDPDSGAGEQTLIWRDPATGVACRAMLDWLPEHSGGRLIVPDYKTCASAEPGAIARSMASYGYHQQAAWYLDGVKALLDLGDLDPAFVFIFQEKTPPYLVTVAQVHPEDITWGRRLNAKAIDTYAECTRAGHWPAYTEQPISIELPAYTRRQLEDAWIAGDLDTTDRSAAA